MSKKIRIIFAVSLLLNLLLLGVVAGKISGVETHSGHGWHESMEGLPDGLRQKVGDTMKMARKKNHDLMKQMRLSREKTIEILKANEFDEKAYSDELEKMNSLRMEMMTNMSSEFKNLMLGLSPEERILVAENFKKMGRKKQW